MSKSFTTKEVAAHKDVDSGLYIIIDNGVYEMGPWIDEHPGGAKILKRVGGKDASKQFWKVSYISHSSGETGEKGRGRTCCGTRLSFTLC